MPQARVLSLGRKPQIGEEQSEISEEMLSPWRAVEQKGKNEQDLPSQGAPEMGGRAKNVFRRPQAGCAQETSPAHWELGDSSYEVTSTGSRLSAFLAVLGGC